MTAWRGRLTAVFAVVVAVTLPMVDAWGAPTKPADLQSERARLVEEKKFDEAFALCRSWANRPSAAERAESHKCAANVFVAQAKRKDAGVFISEGRDLLFAGAPAGGPVFEGPPISSALDELAAAVQITPQDSSIHQGRLFLALRSGEFAKAVEYVEEAMKARPSAKAETWAEYLPNFQQARGAAYGATYAKLLYDKFGDPELLASHATFLVLAGRPAEALPPLTQVLAKRPRDARVHWKLARALEENGDLEGAAKEYDASVKLDRTDTRAERTCIFASFVATRLKDPARAATLEKQGKCR